jgi:hypothetical protein
MLHAFKIVQNVTVEFFSVFFGFFNVTIHFSSGLLSWGHLLHLNILLYLQQLFPIHPCCLPYLLSLLPLFCQCINLAH